MTIDELNALESGTPLYLPGNWDVATWLYAGRVPGRDYFTFTHPPDPDGFVSNKRPVYLHVMDLVGATTSEIDAWHVVFKTLQERACHIQTHILAPTPD
ncbi:MAG: hypothetical protein JWP57_698 [Spirosoma sp.]|nr:hypothetical protein [Spirosoma sp.]